ncbi:MAG: NADH-quinone oxidoreductase subunit C [candidate division NC10 bacterium]|nr:NADH-quinone oxidoreductase subunit C [candidate division NC10 bacterium]
MGVGGEEPRVVAKLRERFPDALQEVRAVRDDLTIVLSPAAIREACRFLRDDPELRYEFLSDLTSVDRLRLPEATPRFEVVYHLTSLRNSSRLRLKVRVPDGEAVDSVTAVWEGANWLEREVYDLMGIPFRDHPDLRRLVLPDDFEGHALRKDFPVTTEPRWWEEKGER